MTLGKFLFLTTYYDYVLAPRIVRHVGEVSERPEAAIFLIYPQFGIKPSHLRTLDHLEDQGYATVVVSNIALSDTDRAAVLSSCSQLLERPNFGYDFGGYRDGIFALGNQLKRLDRLVLLNDSCWFPLTENDDWLSRAKSLDLDYVGASSHFGVRHPDATDYETIEWKYRTTPSYFHYSSFALSLSPKIFRTKRFYSFWKRFALSNEKNVTVRRGEIGLTQWVLARGYSHGATLDIAHLDKDLQKLDRQRLSQLASSLIFADDKRMEAVTREFAESLNEVTSEQMISLILTSVARQGVSYVLAQYSISEMGHSFLKKSPVWLSKEGSDITLKIIRNLPEPIRTELMSEAHELRERKAKF